MLAQPHPPCVARPATGGLTPLASTDPARADALLEGGASLPPPWLVGMLRSPECHPLLSVRVALPSPIRRRRVRSGWN
eukprot:COSAG01_NODE_1226_length_11140_cov_73.834798_11_plen_78_part_00